MKINKNFLSLNWTNVELLKPFTTETGRILPRRITKLSAKEQRYISKLIKKARNMLLMK